MKRKKSICIVIVVLSVFFILIAYAAKMGQETIKKETEKESERQQEEIQVMSAEDTIRAFADLIYTYDTSERHFYEGTEVYMTEAAHERMVPMQSEEPDTKIRSMSSKLLDITAYYRMEDENHISVLAEVWYRLSSSGKYRCRQLIKMQLMKEDKWLISDYTVLDTMEE